ncbi:MAG: cobalt ECF transporter T component CbiQ [Candidatus Omnitrophica bacterium]|nr:cobalt ECF transporter T component CbiQ [Candidatus Omnitrophota bacterium]MDD5653291.1 cobalt ECF transporter T component CbiQ [Candidatus Omnitrophota bacterium]
MKRHSNNFIEHSLIGTLDFLKESLFAEEFALKKGFLQLLDPRIKVLTFLLLIIQAVLIKNILILFYLYALCLLLAAISRINLGFFLKRTWVFIPLFSLVIAIPALFSIFSPGEALVTFKLLSIKFVITQQGLSGAALFVMRVITCVSFAVLMSITTKHFELLKVLRIFKVPQVFVMIAGMCYRYVYLFIGIIENTYLAIKSRTGTRIHYKRGQQIVAWNIAYLWSRSYCLNEQVYQAMLSRGYTGEPEVLNDFRARIKDWLWLFCVLGICAFLFYLSRR